MTVDKLKGVFRLYADFLLGRGAAMAHRPDDPVGDGHLLYMCQTAVVVLIPQGRVEKAMRWLGWVQCALVSRGLFTLEDVKSHSRPDGGPGEGAGDAVGG